MCDRILFQLSYAAAQSNQEYSNSRSPIPSWMGYQSLTEGNWYPIGIHLGREKQSEVKLLVKANNTATR